MGQSGSKKLVKIAVMGLDNSGKTTACQYLKDGTTGPTEPTTSFELSSLVRDGEEIELWDIGGMDKLPTFWRHYLVNVKGLIFVVDASDSARFEEAAQFLNALLEFPDLKGVKLLVLANKTDKNGVPDHWTVRNALGLQHVMDREWHLQPVVAAKGTGLNEGLRRLLALIHK